MAGQHDIQYIKIVLLTQLYSSLHFLPNILRIKMRPLLLRLPSWGFIRWFLLFNWYVKVVDINLFLWTLDPHQYEISTKINFILQIYEVLRPVYGKSPEDVCRNLNLCLEPRAKKVGSVRSTPSQPTATKNLKPLEERKANALRVAHLADVHIEPRYVEVVICFILTIFIK